jgi:hypothetical protein
MMTNLLLFRMPSVFGLLAIVIYLGFIVLVVIGLIRFVKFLGSVPKEQKLLRMELGKLAEEVHQIRKDLKVKE